MSQTQSQQPAHPTLINLPPPNSQPDTPSDMPGTPTSTTTSISALSTIAIKDGHRGHQHPNNPLRQHQHNPSTASLEAERADRISRLAGLERVSTLRASNVSAHAQSSPQTTPTSSGFPNTAAAGNPVTHATAPGGLTPSYFDGNGQPVANTKMSTVGTASATESVGGRTAVDDDGDDIMSMDTNYRELDSASGFGGGPLTGVMSLDDNDGGAAADADDRMSDDGSASLVAFGEGAGSTVSGPIYQRRPLPGGFVTERSASGLSEAAQQRREALALAAAREQSDTPVSAHAMMERREARLMDGVAAGRGPGSTANEEMFVDTTTRGPVPAQPESALRESQLRGGGGGGGGDQPAVASPSREHAERIVTERLDSGEGRQPGTGLGSPKGSESLGRFYFEERK